MAAGGTGVTAQRRGAGDGIAVLTFANPPGNALSAPLRAALMETLAALAADNGLRGVVLAGAGRHFSAATSIDAGPGDAEARPTLAELCDLVEGLPVPVVAAIDGSAVGPGAELALAAHYRVAGTGMRIVLPEIGLGLPPQGGATQRLPRLVGTAEALRMLLHARAVAAEEALAMGLVDLLAEGDSIGGAVELAETAPGPRPTAMRGDALSGAAEHAAAIAAAREEVRRSRLPAPARIVDCIEAALYLPFQNGMALEAVAHEDLAESDESHGLIAAARAERAAIRLPAAIAQARPAAVARIGLLGASARTAAFAYMALNRGLHVTWVEADPARLTQGLAWLDDRMGEEVRAGRLSALQRDADRARLSTAPETGALTGAELVIHAGAGRGAGVAAIARMLPEAPQLVIGGASGEIGLALSPNARVAELALPEGIAPLPVATAVQVLRRLALVPVLTGGLPVAGTSVAAAGNAALVRLLELGVPRRVVASALEGFGLPPSELPELPAAAPMRAMTEEEVLRRWLAAMANEGFALLDRGGVRQASDVDFLLVQGFGFPRWRGGPMHQAAQRGLMVLRADMRRWSAEDPLWCPHPLIDRMVAEGRRLPGLEAA